MDLRGTTPARLQRALHLTGGTGKFLGITGESEFVVKTVVQELAPGSGPEDIKETMGGLAVWPEFRYRIP